MKRALDTSESVPEITEDALSLVFGYLRPEDNAMCSLVDKLWNRASGRSWEGMKPSGRFVKFFPGKTNLAVLISYQLFGGQCIYPKIMKGLWTRTK